MKNKLGMGWLPDYPDFRDYTPEHKEIAPLMMKAKVTDPGSVQLPTSVDLRQWCPPIEDRSELGVRNV